jgi:GTP-binding protein EngB required for normal cell division
VSGDARTPGAVLHRLDALERFVSLAAGRVPDAVLEPARGLLDRGGTRLSLSGEHTVVALAGSTGSGKSSVFNALARMELSPVGHLRPTTGEAHACVWGPAGADALLDWLGVAPAHRFRRESALDADDEASLRGLVLLDLPDMDSVATGHRIEVDRLVGTVDLVVWVLDPQKYADQAVHEQYLRHMAPLREVTMVVLNQVDRLPAADADRCRADLARLVEVDGLPGVPVLAISAATGQGIDELRAMVEKAVGARQAALARLEGEIDSMAEELAPYVGTDVPLPGDGPVQILLDALASASGVAAIAAATAEEYQRRAAVPGWPFRRGRIRVEADPGPGQPATVAVAAHRFADQASADLPEAWADAVRDHVHAATDLADELGRAVTVARPRRPRVWLARTARVLWWLAVLVGLASLGRLLTGHGRWPDLDRWAARLPAPDGVDPVGLIGAAALAVVLLLPPLAAGLRRRRTRRVRARVEAQLREAVAALGRERVISPVRATLRDYHDAREALATARF